MESHKLLDEKKTLEKFLRLYCAGCDHVIVFVDEEPSRSLNVFYIHDFFGPHAFLYPDVEAVNTWPFCPKCGRRVDESFWQILRKYAHGEYQ